MTLKMSVGIYVHFIKKRVNSMPANIGIAMKIANLGCWCYKNHLRLCAKVFYAINYIFFSCVIPPTVKIGKGTSIAHSLGVVIHHTANIGENCHILHNVTIGNEGVVIGNNVLLGCGCVIQGPCTIGNNVKIGSNTFIDFDVPDNLTVVGGCKGRILNKT